MKIAFVAPFYGRHAAGGAESETRNTALRLAARGVDVEVLTTGLLDLQHDWNIDAHPSGVTIDEGVTVRRFRSERIDKLAFDVRHEPLMRGESVTDEQARQLAALMINSFNLYRYLDAHRDDYDWICFIPYLFGTTLHGSRICPEKSVLIPCLHDEGYARMEPVRDLFHRVARIVYHTPAEQRLAASLYGNHAGTGLLIGEGVDTNLMADAGRFRSTYGITDPFMLYCGRKDASKNTPALLDNFARWSAARRHVPLKLVLAGPGTVHPPATIRNRVIDLGFIPKQDQLDAYAAASVFCQPSLNESFSLVLMEAWDIGRPVLVDARCEVLRDHVAAAGGGLYYQSPAEFGAMLDYLLAHPETADAMGRAGRTYVREHYAWDHVIDRYLSEVFVA